MAQNRDTAPAPPPSTARGGFIVIRRETGGIERLKPAMRPFEHANAASACAEAQMRAAKHGGEFAVFQELGSAKAPLKEADHA